MSRNGVGGGVKTKALTNGHTQQQLCGNCACTTMGVVCGTHKHRKLDLANGTGNGMIRHAPCDCECALAPQGALQVANGGSALTSHSDDAERPATGVWSYTPWRNGFYEFKSDIAGKCSRFVRSYVFWSSSTTPAVTAEENNNHNNNNTNSNNKSRRNKSRKSWTHVPADVMKIIKNAVVVRTGYM